MTEGPGALEAHLATGITTVCRCWSLTRRDGVRYGFTDHDGDLSFDGLVFRADTGLTARAVQQTTGLAVDNTEVLGILNDAAISDADVDAGRFDGALVEAWLVNWAAPKERVLKFRGSLGEIERSGGSFRAELRGLAEKLNEPRGVVYQRPCAAVLGDNRCRVDLDAPGMSVEVPVSSVAERRILVVPAIAEFYERWFERGRIIVRSGAAQGLVGVVKSDRLLGATRRIELWEELRAPLEPGDRVRIEAGCDKRPETCRLKFANFLNFRGFPHIPGEDWQIGYPSRQRVNDGGSLYR